MDFDRLTRVLDRTVDGTMSERFRLSPMRRRPGGRVDLDPDRSIVVARGVYDLRIQEPLIEAGVRDGSGNDFHASPIRRTPMLSISTAQMRGQEIRQGDHVDLLDRSEAFEVVSVRPDGHGRTVLILA